jgi:hypothetical protein
VTTQTLTATDVVTAVRRRYGAETDNIGPEWAALDELSSSGGGLARRADLFLVRAWAGRPRGHERILVEVKVSRSDLLHELAAPEKMAVFAAYAHRVYFAAPAGLVRPTDDLGEGVGLLEVSGGGTREVRKAVRRPDPEPLTEQLVVEVFRRAARAEARVRTASVSGDAAAQVVALTERLATALGNESRARDAARRDAGRLQEWVALVARVGGVPCTCGATLARTKDPHGSRMHGHRHADGAPCPDRWAQPDTDVLAQRLGLGLGIDQDAIAS